MTKQRNYMLNSPHLYSVFFAPRGNSRMLQLGMQIAQQYLNPEDKLIGIIGEAGAGKSMLIKGMFPGLDLCNDDSGVNIRPCLLYTSRQLLKPPCTRTVRTVV